MMKKKGFTIIELLAVIILLALIIVIGVGVYHEINENTLKKQLDNKIKTIEIAAEKWAEETNLQTSITITVTKLIDSGYLQADKVENNEIIYTNPVDNTSLLCYTIEIQKNQNQYTADFKLEDGENCDLTYSEKVDENIIIKAYSYQSGKITKEITNTNNVLDWVNTDVLIQVNSPKYDFTSITYTPNGGVVTKKEVNNNTIENINLNQQINPDEYANTYLVSVTIFLNDTYTIALNTKEGTKFSTLNVRIDKEIASINASVSGTWTKNPTKEALITGSDGQGSGLKGFYISTSPTNYTSENFYPSIYELKQDLKMGTYYLWTLDNVGNIAENYQAKLVVNNIDTNPPIIYEDTLDIRLNEDFSYNISIEATDKESGILGYYIGNQSCANAEYAVNLKDSYDTNKSYGDYRLCVKDQVGNISEMNVGAHITYNIDFNKIQLVSLQQEIKFEGNLIFVLDVSGSMSGTRINSLKTVTKEIINGLEFNNNLSVSVISFASSAKTLISQSRDKNAVLSKINSLSASGGTNFSSAIEQTHSVINSINNNKGNYVIFLSDGSSSSMPSTSTLNAVKNKATIYSIGAGSGVREQQLLTIATSSEHYYSSSIAVEKMREVFRDIITNITEEYAKLVEEPITDGTKKIETIRIDDKYPVTITINGIERARYTSTNDVVYIQNGSFYFNLYKLMAKLNLKVNDLENIVVKYYYEEK